jgi:hypothetical protein
MTTEPTTTDPVEPAPTPDTEPLGPQKPQQETGEPAADEHTKAGRDAARYRRQLRETEAERDSLRGRVEALQRAEVERLAQQHITKGEALWTAGADLTALLREDGTVDPAKVAAAAQTAADTLGLTRPMPDLYIPAEGRIPEAPLRRDPWLEAFTPNDRRA